MKYFFIMFLILSTNHQLFASDNIREKNKMSALYPDNIETNLQIDSNLKQCTIQIGEIIDDRKDKQIAGVLLGRPLYSPEDNEQWLRSVIDALKARQLILSNSEGNVDEQKNKIVSFNLFKMWVTNTGRNSSSTIIMYMTSNGNKKLYRGSNVRGLEWSSGPKKMQKTLNVAIGQVLDKMAIDIHKACGNEVTLRD